MWGGGPKGRGWGMGKGGGRQGGRGGRGDRVNEGNGKVELGWLGLMGTVGMGNGVLGWLGCFFGWIFFSDEKFILLVFGSEFKQKVILMKKRRDDGVLFEISLIKGTKIFNICSFFITCVFCLLVDLNCLIN